MSTGSVPRSRDNVTFHFVNANEDTSLTGTVLVRQGQMVLDIPGGGGPYLIVGEAIGHHYEGTNTVRGVCSPVNARWADVGGMFVGVWFENAEEFLFSFELPDS
jgi:hypothetical protein